MNISSYTQLNTRIYARGKRPLRNLSPNDKVRAIQRIHNGETKASVSRDIGVPESTLRGWCKNEQKLRFMCLQTNDVNTIETLPNLSQENLQPAVKKSKLDIYNQFTIATKIIAEISNIDKMNRLNLTKNNNSKCDNAMLEDALSEFITGKFLQNSEESILKRGDPKMPHMFSLPRITTTTKYENNIFNEHILKTSMLISDINTFFPTASENFAPKVFQCGTHYKNPYFPNYFNKESTCSTETSDYSLPLKERKNDYINFNETDIKYNNNNEDEFLQWQKIFNASLSIFALSSAATTCQPSSLFALKSDIPEKYASTEEPSYEISTSIVQNNISNEAPEDLSLSSVNSKMF